MNKTIPRLFFLFALMAAFLVPAWGQNTAGSSIASKTLLSSICHGVPWQHNY